MTAAARSDPRSPRSKSGTRTDRGPEEDRARKKRRLLVALPVAGRAGAEIDGLRRAVGSSSLGRIEPHVTLVAPINVREDALSDALALVRQQTSVEPITVVLGPARTFAPRNPVVYLEVGGDVAVIDRLHRSLSSPPFAPPPARRERPFVAHVTIASGMEKEAIPAAVRAFGRFQLETSLSHLAVYEQQANDPRHSWRRLADAELGSAVTTGRGGRELTFVTSTLTSPDVATWADQLADRAQPSREPLVIVALASDRVVGLAEGGEAGDRIEIHRFVVDPHHQREGIGGQLLSALEREAARRGRTAIAFFSTEDEATRSFLSGRGYGRVATLPSWWGDRDVGVFERPFAVNPDRSAGTG